MTKHQEILKELKEIKQLLWIENINERFKAIDRKLDNVEGDGELRWKKLLAVEKYLGIKFEEGYRYTRNEKKLLQKKNR